MEKFNKNNKYKIESNKELGVYKLIFNDCPKAYFEQTGVTFKKRIRDVTLAVGIS